MIASTDIALDLAGYFTGQKVANEIALQSARIGTSAAKGDWVGVGGNVAEASVGDLLTRASDAFGTPDPAGPYLKASRNLDYAKGVQKGVQKLNTADTIINGGSEAIRSYDKAVNDLKKANDKIQQLLDELKSKPAGQCTCPEDCECTCKDCNCKKPDDEGGDDTKVITSVSPEDLYGPAGYDPDETPDAEKQRWIQNPTAPLHYRIDIWNKPDAPTSTQDAVIENVLDPDIFDLSTFQFTRVGCLDWDVEISSGQVLFTRIDLRTNPKGGDAPTYDVIVEVTGNIDLETGKITWWFHCVDPFTGDLLEDPFAGFLPPFNPETGWEIGWMEYTVKAQPNLPTGTQLQSRAFVEFDFAGDIYDHPAPIYGPWINTIDATPPESSITAFPSRQAGTQFTVSWSGTDIGSGVACFDIYVSIDDGEFIIWLTQTTDSSGIYTGEIGSTYSFYSIAYDNVGLMEIGEKSAEATVLVTDTPTDGETPSTVVTTLDDVVDANDGLISLREAIAYAGTNGLGTTIMFDPSLFGKTITLDGEQLVIDKNIVINAAGVNITIDADQRSRVFEIADCEVELIGLTVTGGSTEGKGGGIFNDGILTVTDCTISGNSAGDGGGIYNRDTLTVTGCTITDNSSTDFGGGIYNSGTLTAANSMISDNAAPRGGGIYNFGGTAEMTNCTVSDNFAYVNGGGIYLNGGTLTLTDSTISGNSASSHGGGINQYGGGGMLEYGGGECTLTITNCVFSDNTAYVGGGINSDPNTLVIVTDSTFSDNSADAGGGICNFGTLKAANSTFYGNTADYGGGIYNVGTVTLMNCAFYDNTVYVGGGIYNDGILTVTDSTFYDNIAFAGGGICSVDTLTAMNSTFFRNSADYGGGIYNSDTTMLTNCTIADNSAEYGGGVCHWNGMMTINNTIVAGNADMDIYHNTGMLSGSNNLIGNGDGQSSLVNGVNGNIVGTEENPIDPGFVNAAQGNYRLAASSPAIDAGCNDWIPDGMTTDLDGNARIYGGVVDIGAYEYGSMPFIVPVSAVITTKPYGPEVSDIHEWQRFWLELRAETEITDGMEFTVMYDADLFVPVAAAGVSGVSLTLGQPQRIDGTTGRMMLTVTVHVNASIPAQVLGTIEFAPATTAVSLDTKPGVAATDVFLDTTKRPWLAVADVPVLTNVWAVPYDLNDDGRVDINDLIRFIQDYGKQAMDGRPLAADFDDTGRVDINDLIKFIQHYGMSVNSTGAISIPRMSVFDQAAAVMAFDMIPPEFAAMFGLVVEMESHVEEVTEVQPEAVLTPDASPAALPVYASTEQDDATNEYVTLDDETAVIYFAANADNEIVIVANAVSEAEPAVVEKSVAHVPTMQSAVLINEPVAASLPQVGEIASVAPPVESVNDIRVAIHQPHSLRQPTASTTRDMYYLLWDGYDSFSSADAGVALLPQTTQAASRQQEVLEFLFAEEQEEEIDASEAEFCQPIRAGIAK